METDRDTDLNLNTRTDSTVAADELFLPSVVALVRHMARMAAERDYRHFLATGEIPYSDPTKERQDD